MQARLLERAALVPGERVLDIACGTGLVTFPAAAAVAPGGRVLATDVSEEMVVRAAGEAHARGVTNVTFSRMNAEALDCADASVDVVLCSLGLMYVPDPPAALREMHRVLKPGGRAVLSVWGARNRCGWAGIFPIVDRRVASEVCPMFFQLGTAQSLAGACDTAGFAPVEDERISATIRFGSAETACGAAFLGGPVALAYARFDERTREEVRREYIDSLAAYRHGETYDVPGEFVVAHAVRPQHRQRPDGRGAGRRD